MSFAADGSVSAVGGPYDQWRSFMPEWCYPTERTSRGRSKAGKLAPERRWLRDGMVEVAHEALFAEWPRLRSWLEEDRDLHRIRRHLREAAREWDRRGRDASELYRGARLDGALGLPPESASDLDEIERTFIEESKPAAEREGTERQRQLIQQTRLNRRLRRAVTALAIALAVAVGTGTLALGHRRSAETQAVRATSRGLGAQSLVDPGLDRALLLALEANRLDDSEDTRSSLLANLLRSPQAVGVMSGGGNRLLNLALRPDGGLLAGSDNHGKTYLWDTQSRQRLDPPLERGFTTSSGLAFSPDGALLATTGVGEAQQGEVVVWDVTSRSRRLPPLEGLSAAADSLAFSGDGARLAGSDAQGRIMVWDLAAQSVLFTVDRPGVGYTYVSLSYTGDVLVSSDVSGGAAIVWDLRTRAPIRTIPGMTQAHALSPDGALLATAGRDNTVYLHEVASGERRGALVGHAGPIFGLAFSGDGRLLASTSDDRTAILWDARTGVRCEVLRGHAGRVLAARFSPDATTLYTNGLDDKVFVWDTSGRQRLGRAGPGLVASSKRNNRTPPLAISPDLTLVASSADERTVTLRGIPDGVPAHPPFGGHEGRLNRVAFSADGSLLATTADDGKATVWDVTTNRRIATLEGGHTGAVTNVAFAPDQHVVATGSPDGKVVLWDIGTGRSIRTLVARDAAAPARGPLVNLTFSPDGRHLAASGGGGDVALWSLPDGALRRLPADSRESTAIAFSPDGRTVATGGQDAKIRPWDADSGRLVGGPLTGHAGYATAAAFAPKGDLLASASTDGTVLLWNIRTGKQVGASLLAPVPGETRQVLRFDRNGRELAVVYEDGQVVTWDLDVDSWRRRSCGVAGRNLSHTEWRKAFGTRPYGLTCAQWPPGL